MALVLGKGGESGKRSRQVQWEEMCAMSPLLLLEGLLCWNQRQPGCYK